MLATIVHLIPFSYVQQFVLTLSRPVLPLEWEAARDSTMFERRSKQYIDREGRSVGALLCIVSKPLKICVISFLTGKENDSKKGFMALIRDIYLRTTSEQVKNHWECMIYLVVSKKRWILKLKAISMSKIDFRFLIIVVWKSRSLR
jgi:hypothetical protein